jgi:hypothetical protein
MASMKLVANPGRSEYLHCLLDHGGKSMTSPAKQGPSLNPGVSVKTIGFAHRQLVEMNLEDGMADPKYPQQEIEEQKQEDHLSIGVKTPPDVVGDQPGARMMEPIVIVPEKPQQLVDEPGLENDFASGMRTLPETPEELNNRPDYAEGMRDLPETDEQRKLRPDFARGERQGEEDIRVHPDFARGQDKEV